MTESYKVTDNKQSVNPLNSLMKIALVVEFRVCGTYVMLVGRQLRNRLRSGDVLQKRTCACLDSAFA